MSSSHSLEHSLEVPKPGKYELSYWGKIWLTLFSLVGVTSFIFLFKIASDRAWSIFLMNHFYFFSLAIGGLFFASLQWITGAMWSAPIRRISEAFTAYFPFAIVTFVVLFFGIHSIYDWSHLSHVKGDIVLEGKTPYLNTTFFIIRNAGALLIWIFFAKKMVGNSVAQDADGDYRHTQKNIRLTPIFLILFALTYTITSFDQLMSLDAHWFSTIYGVYCFAGLFYSVLALTCIFTINLRRRGLLDGILNENHLHDLGKFMFAFTVFWAYIGFSQFMLIWYANLPEETGYYLHRMTPGWMWVSVFLLVGKFFFPFLLLMARGSKRRESRLYFVAWFMMFAQWVDVLWLVQPDFFADGPKIGLLEIGVTLGFVGVFGLLVTRFLSKHNIVPIGDPRLAESVHHHHQ